jgi:glutamate--cysteine ligase
MAVHVDNDFQLASYDDFLKPFHEAEKPVSEFRCGAEMEKFGVIDGGSVLPYEGPVSVRTVMKSLEDGYGWVPEAETHGGPVLALLRSGASITLEPGSQFELSGAPLDHAHDICREFRNHLSEIRPVSERLGIKWLGLGFHPFSKRADYTFVPKQRYGIMREYLPTRGKYALDMMLRTATVQGNYDYISEKDAMRKLRVGLRLSAVTTALFANSPFYEGVPFGGKSYRARVWLDMDPDRSGLVPGVWKEDATYRDYVEWALAVPMFMFKRGDEKFANTGQTFKSFFDDGFQGHKPLMSDWLTHLNTLFPEVRLKKTIEVRGADSQGAATACALPALFLGVYYDDKALDAADALTHDFTFAEVEASRQHVWEKGLGAPFRNGTLQPIAEKLIEIAEGGLERRKKLSSKGNDERVHLTKIKAWAAKGQSPADALLEGLDKVQDVRAEIIRRADLHQ